MWHKSLHTLQQLEFVNVWLTVRCQTLAVTKIPTAVAVCAIAQRVTVRLGTQVRSYYDLERCSTKSRTTTTATDEPEEFIMPCDLSGNAESPPIGVRIANDFIGFHTRRPPEFNSAKRSSHWLVLLLPTRIALLESVLSSQPLSWRP